MTYDDVHISDRKQKVLIADDSEMNRSILAYMLGDDFDIIEVSDGIEAIAALQKYDTEISLVLLDIVMPKMDGFDVLAAMNKYNWIQNIPVIMISAESDASYIERAYDLGAVDYISRPFDEFVVRKRAVNTIMLYAKQKRLVELVAEQIEEKERNSDMMISILSHIVEFRNGESGLHVLHIKLITEILLRHLIIKTDKYKLSEEDISLIVLGSALHDIGKIGIPEEILNKPGRLTSEEFEVMKTHSALGAQMLDSIPFREDEKLLKTAHEICLWHHERYDGRGYPDGLKGEDIPISAQVVSIADVYDALTSERVYKKAYSHEKAMEMIINGECGTFNPLIVECLKDCADEIRQALKENALMSRSSVNKIHEKTEELIRRGELSELERTLKYFEKEKEKYQFFVSISDDIFFDYTVAPPVFTISPLGARKLGIEEVTAKPSENEDFIKAFGNDSVKLINDITKQTSEENPIIKGKINVRIDGQLQTHDLIVRVDRSKEGETEGIIGKIINS